MWSECELRTFQLEETTGLCCQNANWRHFSWWKLLVCVVRYKLMTFWLVGTTDLYTQNANFWRGNYWSVWSECELMMFQMVGATGLCGHIANWWRFRWWGLLFCVIIMRTDDVSDGGTYWSVWSEFELITFQLVETTDLSGQNANCWRFSWWKLLICVVRMRTVDVSAGENYWSVWSEFELMTFQLVKTTGLCDYNANWWRFRWWELLARVLIKRAEDASIGESFWRVWSEHELMMFQLAGATGRCIHNTSCLCLIWLEPV